MKKQETITRRSLIKKSAIAAAGGTLLMNLPVHAFGTENKSTKVILIRHKDVVGNKGKINADILQDMLDRAVTSLTGE